MKVCVVSRNIGNDYKGNFEFDQALALKEKGHEVYVLSLDFRSVRRKRKWGIYWSEYKGVHVLRCSFPMGPINDKIFQAVARNRFKKAFEILKKRSGRLDIVHTHFIGISYIAVYTMKEIIKDTTPVVATEHSSTANVSLEQMEDITKRESYYVYNRVDELISVSNSLADNIFENFGIKSKVVYNVFDSEIFELPNREQKREDFVFISAGNLTENKRMNLLIKGFDRAFGNDVNKNVKLYIFGEGPEKDNLKALICERRLDDRVILMGKKSRRELSGFYNKADVFALLSEKETFGVAYIEAMAMGMPVIASYSGGPQSFVNEKVGMFTHDDECEVAETLLEMKTNIEQYDSKYISDYAKHICSPKTIAEELTEIYEETLRGNYGENSK